MLLITLYFAHLQLDNDRFINCNFFWFFTLLQVVKEKNRATYAEFLIVMVKKSKAYKSRKYQFKKYYFLNWYLAALRSALSKFYIAGVKNYRYMKSVISLPCISQGAEHPYHCNHCNLPSVTYLVDPY